MIQKPSYKLAPILLFVYNRVDTLKLTCDSLQNNIWSNHSSLYIFSDCYKSKKDKGQVEEVRAYIKQIRGFKYIEIIEARENKGLALSIITGVSTLIEKFGKVIVLEDDLISSNNFLIYMNEALNHFQEKKEIFTISGFTPPLNNVCNEEIYFTKRASSWGWATWKDRWEGIDWEVKDYIYFLSSYKQQKEFNRMGSDMTKMLKNQMKGIIDSWAIRWTYWQFKNDVYTVYPTVSKIQNIGTSNTATNTQDNFNRFKTILDKSCEHNFNFSKEAKIELYFIRQFLNQFSIKNRIKYKILNLLFS
jgi:hypothetical protein